MSFQRITKGFASSSAPPPEASLSLGPLATSRGSPWAVAGHWASVFRHFWALLGPPLQIVAQLRGCGLWNALYTPTAHHQGAAQPCRWPVAPLG